MTSTAKQPRQRWPGGYVKNGTFYIERKIHGHKYHFSTACTSLRAAMKHLEAFEADPKSFHPSNVAKAKGELDVLVLNQALIDSFHNWHLSRVSQTWARTVKSLLIDWANHLKGKDLRELDVVDDLKPHLVGATTPHHRVKAIRTLTKWLRQEVGLMKRADDATLDLPVPILAPAQVDPSKAKDVPWEDFQKTVKFLPAHVRDVAEVLGATGWHISDLRRFAMSGWIRPREKGDQTGVVGVIGTEIIKGTSKRGHASALMHREHFEAAQRIKERGTVIGNSRLSKHMARACAKAKVTAFNLGAMRASSGTWLIKQGVNVDDTSRFLGHMSTSTTERHYINMRTPKKVLPKAALRVVK